MTILDELAEYAKERVQVAKEQTREAEMKRLAMELPKGDFSFEKAIRKRGMSFIC